MKSSQEEEAKKSSQEEEAKKSSQEELAIPEKYYQKLSTKDYSDRSVNSFMLIPGKPQYFVYINLTSFNKLGEIRDDWISMLNGRKDYPSNNYFLKGPLESSNQDTIKNFKNYEIIDFLTGSKALTLMSESVQEKHRPYTKLEQDILGNIVISTPNVKSENCKGAKFLHMSGVMTKGELADVAQPAQDNPADEKRFVAQYAEEFKSRLLTSLGAANDDIEGNHNKKAVVILNIGGGNFAFDPKKVTQLNVDLVSETLQENHHKFSNIIFVYFKYEKEGSDGKCLHEVTCSEFGNIILYTGSSRIKKLDFTSKIPVSNTKILTHSDPLDYFVEPMKHMEHLGQMEQNPKLQAKLQDMLKENKSKIDGVIVIPWDHNTFFYNEGNLGYYSSPDARTLPHTSHLFEAMYDKEKQWTTSFQKYGCVKLSTTMNKVLKEIGPRWIECNEENLEVLNDGEPQYQNYEGDVENDLAQLDSIMTGEQPNH
jgi:hypothetical protein